MHKLVSIGLTKGKNRGAKTCLRLSYLILSFCVDETAKNKLQLLYSIPWYKQELKEQKMTLLSNIVFKMVNLFIP